MILDGFKSRLDHHPVLQFLYFSENRSKFARVRAICDCAWTRRAAPGGADRGEHGKTYPGSILLGQRMFARTSHSSIEPELLAPIWMCPFPILAAGFC